MIFIVTLIALLIERFFDWSHLRRWNWFLGYQRMVSQRAAGMPPYLSLAVTLIPPLFVTVLVQFMLKDALFGFVELLFQLLVFLYCLGPQNLWADTFACVNALVQGDASAAKQKLRAAFGAPQGEDTQTCPDQLLNQVFIAANRRVFAIVFWFMVLGPAGAVLYRAVTVLTGMPSARDVTADKMKEARWVESVLDWIPVRILTCVFALGGHFVKVFSCWRKKSVLSLDINEKLLTECGAAALGAENAAEGEGAAVKNAIGLLDRSFVITLVMVAIIVLLG
ncbi:hypothetical protein AQUSIP_05550 [Aquicella siphonis]|uniref:Regulatory protein AmpE n=1 Tax=Aquicella siphonis TaxID=254247 RepID=A0A5E4PFQ4_9COXI|nr:regulatory signaling modulator protein AmpE [Aquicella siphonis]VVC75267.1 hypothetical protein AQUSIP_05550 [Aquicella siphonis]